MLETLALEFDMIGRIELFSKANKMVLREKVSISPCCHVTLKPSFFTEF